MKKYFSGKPIMFVICLLCSVGMLFLNSPLAVSATGNPDSLLGQGGRTGVTDTQTNINEPGASDNPDELRELNVANNLTVTYNNGNGDIAGPIRILIADHDCVGAYAADYADRFYQDHHCAAFYENGAEYADRTAQSGINGAGPVFDILYYASGFDGNQ